MAGSTVRSCSSSGWSSILAGAQPEGRRNGAVSVAHAFARGSGVAPAGCLTHRSETAQDPRGKMVGMQQGQMLACMGTPTRKILETAGEVWEYSTGNGTTSTNASTADSNNFNSRLCDINMVFSNGQVSAVKYTGPFGGAPVSSDQCTNAISPCVKQAHRDKA